MLSNTATNGKEDLWNVHRDENRVADDGKVDRVYVGVSRGEMWGPDGRTGPSDEPEGDDVVDDELVVVTPRLLEAGGRTSASARKFGVERASAPEPEDEHLLEPVRRLESHCQLSCPLI